MQNKFLTLVENNITRYTNGGMLVGDVVELVSGYKSDEHFKKLSDEMKKAVADFFHISDLNKRVINIKTHYPSKNPGDENNRGDCFTVEIAAETAPGRYDKEHAITVPSTILKVVPQDGSNLPSIPTSIRKQERINHKPVSPEEDEEVPNNPYLQTLMTQDGNKLTRGDKSLNNFNTIIPSKPDASMKDPAVKGFSKVYSKLPAKIK